MKILTIILLFIAGSTNAQPVTPAKYSADSTMWVTYNSLQDRKIEALAARLIILENQYTIIDSTTLGLKKSGANDSLWARVKSFDSTYISLRISAAQTAADLNTRTTDTVRRAMIRYYGLNKEDNAATNKRVDTANQKIAVIQQQDLADIYNGLTLLSQALGDLKNGLSLTNDQIQIIKAWAKTLNLQ